MAARSDCLSNLPSHRLGNLILVTYNSELDVRRQLTPKQKQRRIKCFVKFSF